MPSTVAERIALRSRAVSLAGLAALIVLAWLYLFLGAGMSAMAGMPVSPSFGTVATMWWVMMVAMMMPAASPTILLYARVHRHSTGLEHRPPTAAFLAGYLMAWLGFALIAAGLQTLLVSPMKMSLAGRDAAGALCILAGLYQISPFKDACLRHCRSPGSFISRHYRPGSLGALRLGMLHGSYCVGCCWLLMALLFVGGVMNLIWAAGLTLLVAAEKLLPGGLWLARIAGLGIFGWGVALVAG